MRCGLHNRGGGAIRGPHLHPPGLGGGSHDEDRVDHLEDARPLALLVLLQVDATRGHFREEKHVDAALERSRSQKSGGVTGRRRVSPARRG